MNAQQLWAGNDYAYLPGRGRGENYRDSAVRVRVLRVFKRKADYASERLSTYVEVEFLTDDGESIPFKPYYGDNGEKPQTIKEIRARDIAAFWDSFVDEREYRRTQAEKFREEQQAKEALEAQKDEQLFSALEGKGIPRYAVTIRGAVVYINRTALEKWLDIKKEGE